MSITAVDSREGGLGGRGRAGSSVLPSSWRGTIMTRAQATEMEAESRDIQDVESEPPRGRLMSEASQGVWQSLGQKGHG